MFRIRHFNILGKRASAAKIDENHILRSKYDCFIFTHIPKCGGTSFRSYVNKGAKMSGISKSRIYIPGENGLKARRNISQLNDLQLMKFRSSRYFVVAMHASPNLHLDYMTYAKSPFYFTLLREPIERFISHYYFFNYKQGNNGCKGISLNDLGEDQLDSILDNMANTMVRFLSGNIQSKRPLSDLDLRIAKNNLVELYPCFGILNDLPKSIDLLKKNAPKWINFNIDFPTKNANIYSRGLSEGINSSVKERIVQSNKLDIELYEYASGLFT